MYSVKVLQISKSTKSAVVEITKEFGFLTSVVARGFIKTNKDVSVGDTMELPLDTKVVEKVSTSTDKESGEVKTFTWVSLD